MQTDNPSSPPLAELVAELEASVQRLGSAEAAREGDRAFVERVRERARQETEDGSWFQLVEAVEEGRVAGRGTLGEVVRAESLVAQVARNLEAERRKVVDRLVFKDRPFRFGRESVNEYIELVSRLLDEIREARRLAEEGAKTLEAAAEKGEAATGLDLEPEAERYFVLRLLEIEELRWQPDAEERLHAARLNDIGNPRVRERLESELYETLRASAHRTFLFGSKRFLEAREEAQEYYQGVAVAARRVLDADIRLRQLRAFDRYLQGRARQLARSMDTTEAIQRAQEILRRITTETAEDEALKRRVRKALAKLDPRAQSSDRTLSERVTGTTLDTSGTTPRYRDGSPVQPEGSIDPSGTDLDDRDTRRLGERDKNYRGNEEKPIGTFGQARGRVTGYAQGIVHPVWFGTNRKPLPGAAGFGTERHDRTTLGRVDVHVPEAHRFGETGSSFWTRLRRLDFRDDRLRIQGVATQARETFYAEIGKALETAREGGEEAHALVFLHGFNVTFEEAAIRAAQIGVDLKVPGATAFFSWPSRGTVAAYPADEATIEASEGAITDFLVDFAAHCGAEKIHLLAHSMGNRGLLRALQRIAANAETRGKVHFGQIFLAAPDVDRDLFLSLARLYPEHGERTTLYASSADLAVHLSSRLHDSPRAGYFIPYTVAPGIDTIAVPDFDVDLLGHSYFAQAEALLHDIYDLLRHGEAPARRQRILPTTYEGLSFWKLRR